MELAKVCAEEDKLKTALEHIEKVYSSQVNHSTQFYYVDCRHEGWIESVSGVIS